MNENVSIFLAGLASFVFSLSVFAAAPRVLSRLSKQYGRLSLEKSVQTDNEFKGTLICIVLGSVGVYVCVFDPEVYPRRARYNCLLLRHGVAGYLGYTIADVLMMMRHKSLFSKVFLVHHFVGTLCGLAGTMFTSVPWIMSTYLYYEASSPFVHLRFLLSNLGWKKTRLYTVNALLLMTVFFLCRVAIIPVYWRTVYLLYTDGSFPQIDAFVYYLMLYGRAFFDVLNVYWFSLMMKVFFEMFVWPNSASKKVN
ncbi:TLC domain-containing protein 4-A-like isoform X1 [Branchiostoma lanceolatum]|uniref:TLC domain-containing protein 4-A-like isoform X1 n=1 Tax=Branchiostoma lanceolatum TaxID=7740 RepID=UPI003452E14D